MKFDGSAGSSFPVHSGEIVLEFPKLERNGDIIEPLNTAYYKPAAMDPNGKCFAAPIGLLNSVVGGEKENGDYSTRTEDCWTVTAHVTEVSCSPDYPYPRAKIKFGENVFLTYPVKLLIEGEDLRPVLHHRKGYYKEWDCKSPS